jgi:uncharacterized MAPEG superfamily protein
MIWTAHPHELASTIRQHSGEACPAPRRMLNGLSQAVHSAGAASQNNFEVADDSILDG